MSKLLTTVQSGLRTATSFVKHNKHTILAVSGVGFTVGSLITMRSAAIKEERETRDLKSSLALMKADKNPVDPKIHKEKMMHTRLNIAKKCLKVYAVPVLLAALGETCHLGSAHIYKREGIAMAAAYSTLDRSFKAYRNRMKEKYGEDAEREIKEGSVKKVTETVIDENGNKKEVTRNFQPNIEDARTVFFHPDTNPLADRRSRRRTIDNIEVALNDCQHILNAENYFFLNQAFNRLAFTINDVGRNKAEASHVLGWNKGSKISFGIRKADGTFTQRVLDFIEYGGDLLLEFNFDGVIINDFAKYIKEDGNI